MKTLRIVLALPLIVLLVACGDGGLGMNIDIKEKDAPTKAPEAVAEATTGKLRITIADKSTKGAQALADALANAFKSEDAPEGVLTFTKLSVRNRSMQQPPRASAEIDATCIWHETGEDPTSYEIRIRTFSIEISDWNKQPKYLRDEALKGMARKLEDEF